MDFAHHREYARNSSDDAMDIAIANYLEDRFQDRLVALYSHDQKADTPSPWKPLMMKQGRHIVLQNEGISRLFELREASFPLSKKELQRQELKSWLGIKLEVGDQLFEVKVQKLPIRKELEPFAVLQNGKRRDAKVEAAPDQQQWPRTPSKKM